MEWNNNRKQRKEVNIKIVADTCHAHSVCSLRVHLLGSFFLVFVRSFVWITIFMEFPEQHRIAKQNFSHWSANRQEMDKTKRVSDIHQIFSRKQKQKFMPKTQFWRLPNEATEPNNRIRNKQTQ